MLLLLLVLSLLLLVVYTACAEAVVGGLFPSPAQLFSEPPAAVEPEPEFNDVASRVATDAVAAAAARPSSFAPPDLELGPQRLWQHFFAPSFVDSSCAASPRLLPAQLEEERDRRLWDRAAAMGAEAFEPLTARQGLVELLMSDRRMAAAARCCPS